MSFDDDIRRFNEKINGKVGDEFKARCISLANDAIKNTPVDTGRLRANWQASFDRMPGGQINAPGGDSRQENERLSSQTALRNIQSAGNFKIRSKELTFYLTNNLPYAVPVEEGTDKTRPRRMLSRAILNATRKL